MILVIFLSCNFLIITFDAGNWQLVCVWTLLVCHRHGQFFGSVLVLVETRVPFESFVHVDDDSPGFPSYCVFVFDVDSKFPSFAGHIGFWMGDCAGVSERLPSLVDGQL